MIKSASQPFRIACVGDPSVKASRYRLSGAIRYAAEQADLTVISVNIDASRMNSRATLDILRKITDNHPDALINLLTLFNALRESSQTFPDIPTALPVSFDISSRDHTHPVDVLGILDDEELCRTAIELALKRGQTNFAYVDTTIPSEHERSEWRFDIYRRLLGAEGHALVRYPAIRSRDEFKNLRHLADWLSSLPKPCMVFAYADNRAHTVIDACHLAHLNIPDQVSVIGIDNDPEICEMVQPTLTSVYPDFELGGYLAAQALHRILRAGKRPRKPIIYHYGVKTIVERGSTQDLRGGGRLVSQAQRIIAESLADPMLSATFLARRLNASRQLIDLRFREIVGRSAHAEIERQRIEKAKTLLRRGDRTITEIIRACGYTNPDTFRNAFKAATGQTPRDFRSTERN